MNQTSILYFLTVCRTHSFSKAAEYLYITPQGVSKAIKKLEDEWECSLFIRTAEGEVLTPAGEIFKIHAEKMREEYLLLEKELSCLEKKETVIGATMGVYQILRTPLLQVLQKKYPNFNISYVESWDLQCEENISDHIFDMALTSGPVDKKKFRSDILYSSSYSVMVPKGHPLEKKEVLNLRDLKQYPLLLMSSHFRPHYVFMECCRKAGFEPVIYDTAVMVESMFHACTDRQVLGILIDCYIEQHAPSDCRIIPIKTEEIHWELVLISALNHPVSMQEQKIRSAIIKIADQSAKEKD